MIKKEFAILADAIKTYYPKENILPNEQAMELWYRELCDIPYKVAESALRKWVATNKWSPTIADIREMAAGVSEGDIPDWGEGWEQVLLAIRKYGHYRIGEAMDSFDPLTRKCVERLGFRNICMSEDINIDRANFRLLYNELAERNRKDRQIAMPLKQLIEGIQQERVMQIEGKVAE